MKSIDKMIVNLKDLHKQLWQAIQDFYNEFIPNYSVEWHQNNPKKALRLVAFGHFFEHFPEYAEKIMENVIKENEELLSKEDITKDTMITCKICNVYHSIWVKCNQESKNEINK